MGLLALVVGLALSAPMTQDWSLFPGDGSHADGVSRFHDPYVVAIDGRYFCFSTSGNGFASFHESKDLLTWKDLGSVTETPQWLVKRIPHRSLWAPSILKEGHRLRMYYCASERFGGNGSVIGMAECAHFNPDRPHDGWVDKGMLIESIDGKSDFNAIDAEPLKDHEGREWLFYGSYWSGLYVVELDPVSGLLKDPSAKPIPVARNADEKGDPIEGAATCYRDGYYYLFVSYGLAAQGIRSTYRIMVGRATSPTGPYLDLTGRSMEEGGHVSVLKGSPPMFGPGHCHILKLDDGRWVMPYHFYDGRKWWHADTWGLPTLQVRELLWSSDGWPMPGLPEEYLLRSRPVPRSSLEGQFIHQVDFGEPHHVVFKSGGEVVDGTVVGTWTQKGDQLTLRWPKEGVPGEYWVDSLTLAYGNNYYVGRNGQGLVIRGFYEGTER